MRYRSSLRVSIIEPASIAKMRRMPCQPAGNCGKALVTHPEWQRPVRCEWIHRCRGRMDAQATLRVPAGQATARRVERQHLGRAVGHQVTRFVDHQRIDAPTAVENAPIRREGGRIDGGLVANQAVLFLQCVCCPDHCRVVEAGADKPAAVRRQSQSFDRSAVCCSRPLADTRPAKVTRMARRHEAFGAPTLSEEYRQLARHAA